MPSTGRSLQGARPHPLKVSKDSWKAGKSSAAGQSSDDGGRQSPMIIYLDSPKVVHARPQEFMRVVQKLTGKDAGGCRGTPAKRELAEEDPLLLTLGQSPSSSAWNLNACLKEFGSMV